MNKKTKGVVLAVVGVIALAIVYSMRPPSGFGDAVLMMTQGRNSYIKEPLYQILFGISALVSGYGGWMAYKNWE